MIHYKHTLTSLASAVCRAEGSLRFGAVRMRLKLQSPLRSLNGELPPTPAWQGQIYKPEDRPMPLVPSLVRSGFLGSYGPGNSGSLASLASCSDSLRLPRKMFSVVQVDRIWPLSSFNAGFSWPRREPIKGSFKSAD